MMMSFKTHGTSSGVRRPESPFKKKKTEKEVGVGGGEGGEEEKEEDYNKTEEETIFSWAGQKLFYKIKQKMTGV